MTQSCPKCLTVRPANATAPDWQCPACGVAYAKAGGTSSAISVRPTSKSSSSSNNGSGIPWRTLIAIFFIISGLVAGYQNFHKSRNGGQMGSIAARIGSSMTPEQAAALAASSKAEDVLFYTAPWCPYCAQAKSWMAQSGFKYEECDIEARSDCASQLRALGSDGVPYLIVKGHHMKDGFDSDEFLAALQQK